ncbi:MAG: GTP cyclohydrolase MptA [Thermoplasmata archaeon]
MKDVHAMAPVNTRLRLREVGVSGVRKPISVQRPGRAETLSAEFSVRVDLPPERKGSDLSRNAELLAELIDATVTRPVQSLEAACREIARELLIRHTYATEAYVEARAQYFLPRGIRPERSSFEDYVLLAEARASRDPAGGDPRLLWKIGAEAVGMTACPCAMETCRALLEKEFPLLRDPSLAALPIVSHNQRNRTTLSFELSEPADIEADRIVAAIEAAQSSPTFAILKRGDEAAVVLNAHRNPKFVEDVIRDVLAQVPILFPEAPDSAVVHARTRSEESIHKYDVTAAHSATLGELRRNPSTG